MITHFLLELHIPLAENHERHIINPAHTNQTFTQMHTHPFTTPPAQTRYNAFMKNQTTTRTTQSMSRTHPDADFHQYHTALPLKPAESRRNPAVFPHPYPRPTRCICQNPAAGSHIYAFPPSAQTSNIVPDSAFC